MTIFFEFCQTNKMINISVSCLVRVRYRKDKVIFIKNEKELRIRQFLFDY